MECCLSQEQLEQSFERMNNSKFIPKGMIHFVQSIYSLQNASHPTFEKAQYTATTVDRNTFLSGTPLYSLQDIPYNKENTAQLFGKILAFLAKEAQYSDEVAFMKTALEDGSFVLSDAYKAFLSGDSAYFDLWQKYFTKKSSMLRFLIQSSITPSLIAFARSVREAFDIEGWAEQYCPVCGSPPLLGYWKNSNGAQYNACSICQTVYRASRIECMYCGETDAEKIEYIRAEEFPLFVLQVCNACKQYGKILDYKEHDFPSIPSLDDMYSIPMDVIAMQQQYSRPVASSWGF